MDPIITKLNQVALDRIRQKSLPELMESTGMNRPDFTSSFDQTLAEKLLEKMQDGSQTHNEMTVLSADDIHVQTSNMAEGGSSPTTDNQYFDLFKEMNKDLLSLDSAIETLATPGLKMTPHQLLALQAGIANTTIMAEGFSRFTDAVARGIQTIVQTQVG